jgi:uncharacterized protein (TIGR02996 family)
MSDEKALLAAIWDHPHEDTPRLVYADWLDEHGDAPRAEFIRVQCELARLGEWDDSPRKAELEKREQQLWKKHAKEWKAGLPPLLQKLGGFERGFPAPRLREMPSSKFLRLRPDDFAGAPLWGFHLPPNNRLLPKVLACPLLARVGTLDFRHWLESPDDARRFAASPNVHNIAELNVSISRLGDAGVRELAAGADSLPNLRRLTLEWNVVTAAGARSLAESPLADRLETLDLSSNPLEAEGIEALADAPRLSRLRRLDLSNWARQGESPKTSAGRAVRRLCDSPHLASLRSLQLHGSGLDDANMREACESRPAFRLVELSLIHQYPKLGNAGAEALAGWPGLEGVRRLNLRANEIGAAGARALARSPYLNNVAELHLDLNPLTKDAAAVGALRDRFGDALRIV